MLDHYGWRLMRLETAPASTWVRWAAVPLGTLMPTGDTLLVLPECMHNYTKDHMHICMVAHAPNPRECYMPQCISWTIHFCIPLEQVGVARVCLGKT